MLILFADLTFHIVLLNTNTIKSETGRLPRSDNLTKYNQACK